MPALDMLHGIGCPCMAHTNPENEATCKRIALHFNNRARFCQRVDPKKMASMFSADRPTYAAQDWAHLCTWDYFVGYWIYLQGQDKKVFTRHSLVLAFNSGAAPSPEPAQQSSSCPGPHPSMVLQ